MTAGQWEQYVEPAADAINEFCYPLRDEGSVADDGDKAIARAMLAAVGPRIAEDTRTRLVTAAGAAVEREASGLDTSRPDQADVDALRGLLDLMVNFRDNDQRARYLLSSNWLRDRGVDAAERLRSATP